MRFARALWNDLQDLTPAECDTVSRFEKDPRGPLFMAAAEILRKRGYIDEAIVIMEDGVNSFPHYHSARAALARDYYFKGLMREALRQVSIVTEKSVDNLMAQRLRLKLAILFEDRHEVRNRLGILKNLFRDDDFTKTVRDLVAYDEWSGVQTLLRSELEDLGIQHNLNTEEESSDSALARLQTQATQTPEPWEISVAQISPSPTWDQASLDITDPNNLADDDPNLPQALKQGTSLASIRGDAERYVALKGFTRVSATGYFLQSLRPNEQGRSHLDSMTLAEILAKQGLVDRSKAIYRRLLREDPANTAAQKALHQLGVDTSPGQSSSQKATHPISSITNTESKSHKINRLQKILDRLEAKGL